MAKNLKQGTTVYQVKQDSNNGPILYKGFITHTDAPNVYRVEWLAPDAPFKGSTTREFPCDLYRTPNRAITAHLRHVKNYLKAQEYEL